jgi:hypothetical protein
VKTWKLLESEFPDNLAERVTDAGSENCKADFIWVCQTLNTFDKESTAENPNGRALSIRTIISPITGGDGMGSPAFICGFLSYRRGHLGRRAS